MIKNEIQRDNLMMLTLFLHSLLSTNSEDGSSTVNSWMLDCSIKLTNNAVEKSSCRLGLYKGRYSYFNDYNIHNIKTVDEQWMKFKNTALHSMKSLIPHKFTRTSCDLLWFISTAQKQIRKHNKLYHQYKISHSLDLRSRFLSLEHEIQWQMRQSHNAHIAKLITTDSEDGSLKEILKLHQETKEGQ